MSMHMTAFVDGIIKSFKDCSRITYSWPNQPRHSLFPAKKWLYKTDASAEESKEVLDLGYQHIVGMLLWACRGAFPECATGLRQLTRAMCNPSKDAWKCTVHMVNLMRVN